ncbi:MAG: hypothetical protein AABX31_05170 [Nanoarchaeota archaeon]
MPEEKSKHPVQVEGYRSLNDLAAAVGKLRYDSLAEFMQKTADDIERQAEADEGRGRTQLAERLRQAADEMY